jgi:hypothetical protein
VDSQSSSTKVGAERLWALSCVIMLGVGTYIADVEVSGAFDSFDQLMFAGMGIFLGVYAMVLLYEVDWKRVIDGH